MKWFRGGIVFKAHRLVYHSTLSLRVMKKKTVSDTPYLFIRQIKLANLVSPGSLRSKIDGVVPHTQHVNVRIFSDAELEPAEMPYSLNPKPQTSSASLVLSSLELSDTEVCEP